MKNFVALTLCILMPWTSFAADGGTSTATPGEIPSVDPAPKAAEAKPAEAKPATAAAPAAAAPATKKIVVTKQDFLNRASKSKDAKVVAALKKYNAVADKDSVEGKAAFETLKKSMGAKTAPATETAVAPTPAAKPIVKKTATSTSAPPVVDQQPPPPGPAAPPHAHPEAVAGGKDGVSSAPAGKDGNTEGGVDCNHCEGNCPGCQPAPPPPVAPRETRVIRETRDAIQESGGTSVGGGLGIGSRELMFGLGGALLGGIAGYMMGRNNGNGFGFTPNTMGYGFNPYAPRMSLPGAYPAPGGFGIGGPFGAGIGGPFGGQGGQFGQGFGRSLPNAYPAPGGAAFGAGSQFGFGYGGGVYGATPIQGINGGVYGQPNLGGYYQVPQIGNPTLGAGGAPIALPFPGPTTYQGYSNVYQQGVNGGIIYNGAR